MSFGYWGLHTAAEEDYRDSHQAPGPDDGAPMHDVTQGIYPASFYDEPFRYWGSDESTGDRDSWGTIHKVRGNPDARVKVHRALPLDVAKRERGVGLAAPLNTGDWVTPSYDYAHEHGMSRLEGNTPWTVVTSTVPASQLHTNGDSLAEWGYNGPPTQGYEGSNAAGKRKYRQQVLKKQQAEALIQRNAKDCEFCEAPAGTPCPGSCYGKKHYPGDRDAPIEHTASTDGVRYARDLQRGIVVPSPVDLDLWGLHTAAEGIGEDYFAHYRAPGPETGTPLHALNSRYYDDLRYHVNKGSAPGEHDAETHDALLAARGNPDHPVTIYRSTPPEHSGQFNTGDWVSTSRAYAAEHGSDDNGRGWPVTSGQARAGDLYNDGNSLQEYGYHGPAMRGESAHHTASTDRVAISEHDVYDSFYDEEEDFSDPPEPHQGPWYHYSPHSLPVGTHLTTGHDSPWGDNYYEKDGTEHRRNYVWLSPSLPEAVGWAGMTPRRGQTGPGHIYRVEPHSDVLPWNGTGSDGWVAEGAHIAEEIPHPWKEPHTASTDGIRYAHLVEADVAEDLTRMRLAAVTQDLVDRLHGEFHDWWDTQPVSDFERRNHGGGDRGPVGYWPNIEKFLKNKYPAAHRNLGVGDEAAGPLMDHPDRFRHTESCPGAPDFTPYQTGPEAEVAHGYDPKEIAAGMLLLHNSTLRGPDVQEMDQNRLNDIAQKRFQMQRDYEQRTKTAMPAPLPKGTYFRYHPELVWSPGVTAHAPGGKMVGSLEWYDDDHVMVDLGTRRPGEIDRIQVPEDQRGQSIATSMFDFAKQHEPRLHHSDQLTPDGEGWSQYEQSRHARLAMAWDEWAPKIEPDIYNAPACTPGQCSYDHEGATGYKINHEHGQSSITYGHYKDDSGNPYIGIIGLLTDDDHRNDGVAESMIRRVHQDHPGVPINPGWMTDMGQAFHDRMLEKEPEARGVVTARLAGRNGDLPPMTMEPFGTKWSNGIMARHAVDGRPLGHLHRYDDGEIETVRVHPDFQRRGIASAMLKHANSDPETYERDQGYDIHHSNNLSDAGRAWANSDGHSPSDDEVEEADGDPHSWAWTAVKDYIPARIPYTGQNEAEMSNNLYPEHPETKVPYKLGHARQHRWPTKWGGNHPDIPFDKRWGPNHREHIPAPWEG